MSEVFLKIVNMSISASWLVIAVLLLRLVLKSIPKWVNVLLWGLVAVRLICPFSVESALSLIPSAEPIPERVITNLMVDVPSELPPFDIPSQDQTDTPLRDETGDQTDVDVLVPEKPGIPVVTVLAFIWSAGVGAMLIYTAVSYLLLRRRVATAVRLENNIYQSENVDSPFVLGIAKAKIYLPFRMDRRDLAHVIAHEQAHIRRKDHWWKPFGFVLLAIHWFNPLMWVGYILLCRDIELACDEKVIREMDNETKADYTEALVACSVNRRRIAACPLAFGEVGVKERVKNVMNYKKPAFWIVIAAVALCIVVAVCFLTNPKTPGLEIDDPTMLEFPELKWGATVEKVKQALNVTDKQIISDQAYGDNTWALWITDVTMFGDEVAYANLIFMKFPWHEEYGLCDVQLYYPDETDMTIVKDMLVELYGEPKDGLGFTRYKVSQGKVESYTDSGTDLASYEGQSTRMINWWESTAKRADVLPADVMDAMIESGIIDPTGNVVDTSDPSSREAVLECLRKDPAVFLYCTDSSSAGTVGVAHYTKNVVHFDATEYMWQLLRYSE